MNSCLKSVEICILKSRGQNIYGVAVFEVCWDGSVVSRFVWSYAEIGELE